ncbi:MAG: hypothetical protein AB7K64_01285 [Variibacter sp.]
MLNKTRISRWVIRNLPLLSFLIPYFILTVVAQFVYASSYSGWWLRLLNRDIDLAEFSTLFSFGYWLLLLLPFAVAPPIFVATRRFAAPIFKKLAHTVPEFTRGEYVIAAAACYAFVIYSFASSDIIGRWGHGAGALDAVDARFQILDLLGYWPRMVLQSPLIFLSIYALVRALRSREAFWWISCLINFFLMTSLLILLGMKWPVLVFYIGLVVAIFANARKRPYLGATFGSTLVMASYLAISVVVLRVVPPPPLPSIEIAQKPTETSKPRKAEQNVPATDKAISEREPSLKAAPGGEPPPLKSVAPKPSGALPPSDIRQSHWGKFLRDMTTEAIDKAPILVAVALDRMALPYMYYYEIFTTEGAVCGGIWAQLERGKKCRPSLLVYERMFEDRFAGRGTAPQAVHIAAYAIGGWSAAIVALILASVILGLFAALSLYENATWGTAYVMGSLAGYFFSQLSGEWVIFYDHAIIWWVALLLAIYILRCACNKWLPPEQRANR